MRMRELSLFERVPSRAARPRARAPIKGPAPTVNCGTVLLLQVQRLQLQYGRFRLRSRSELARMSRTAPAVLSSKVQARTCT